MISSREERPARVVHISDLHFGFQFQTDNWTELKNKVKKLDPDLVVVTGDLVNTPWRWMLRRSGAGIKDLH